MLNVFVHGVDGERVDGFKRQTSSLAIDKRDIVTRKRTEQKNKLARSNSKRLKFIRVVPFTSETVHATNELKLLLGTATGAVVQHHDAVKKMVQD